MRRSVRLVAIVCVAPFLLGPAAAKAQQPPMHAEGFDASRAILGDAPMFDPFYVDGVESMRQALRDRVVDEETPLLVISRAGQTLGLLTYQMAYHHVAQGDISGEPWLVAF